MSYEKTYYADVARGLSKAKNAEEFLDKELKIIKERMLTLNSAREQMIKGYEIVLKALKHAYPDLDLNDENLDGTPDRMARALLETCSGLGVQNDREIFCKSFPLGEYNEMIMLKDIEYTSVCAHHFFPFTGVAHIGYLPREIESEKAGHQVVGLSKLARIVDVYASRPQLQERLCVDIMESIKREIKPSGVMVVIEGKHGCLACRGAKKENATMITSAVDGHFKGSQKLRSEFLNLLQMRS
ncbi:MAG: GTP cyclohydrolase I [Oligoflexia bacterium]|nr:GTP cyclohydrolase I [Oligoflexia bacterium]